MLTCKKCGKVAWENEVAVTSTCDCNVGFIFEMSATCRGESQTAADVKPKLSFKKLFVALQALVSNRKRV